MPWRPIRPAAGWRRFYRTGIFVSVLLAGCSSWHQPMPIPLELNRGRGQARLRIPRGGNVNLAGTVIGSSQRSIHPKLYPSTECRARASGVLAGRRHRLCPATQPPLRSARAAMERARGQEQAAFAPFLPEVDLLFQSGATRDNQGPGITGPTGFILTSDTPGTHSYAQTELQLL